MFYINLTLLAFVIGMMEEQNTFLTKGYFISTVYIYILDKNELYVIFPAPKISKKLDFTHQCHYYVIIMTHIERHKMNYVKFTDFRNHSKKYFDNVEHGNSYIIIRKGKPIAIISPFNKSTTGWKRENRKIKLKNNKTTLEYILQERSEK